MKYFFLVFGLVVVITIIATLIYNAFTKIINKSTYDDSKTLMANSPDSNEPFSEISFDETLEIGIKSRLKSGITIVDGEQYDI